MKRLLIDTDVFIDFLRGYPPAKNYFESLKTGKKLVFSSIITEIELLGGKDCESIEKRNQVSALVSLANQVTIDRSIVEKSGEFIRKHDIEVPDAIVAATAFNSKATIITRNVKDYEKIKEVRVKKPY